MVAIVSTVLDALPSFQDRIFDSDDSAEMGWPPSQLARLETLSVESDLDFSYGYIC